MMQTLKLFLAVLGAVFFLSADAVEISDTSTGMNCEHWDKGTTTTWTNVGGDWVDAAGTAQGAVPFKTAVLDDVDSVRSIGFDVSNIVQSWNDSSKYRGFVIKSMGGGNAATFSSREGAYPPRLRIIYGDLTEYSYYPSADSKIKCPGGAVYGTTTSMLMNSDIPAVLAYNNVTRRPDVISATLVMTSVVQYGSTTWGVFQLVDPQAGGGGGGGGGGGDLTPPQLSTKSPLDNASSVAINTNIVLTFSENVVAGTGLIGLYSGGSLVESFNVATGVGSAGGTVVFNGTTGVTVNPNADLSYLTGYYVQVASTAVKDAAGNFYAGISDQTSWNFTTVVEPDTTPPGLSSSDPADNATAVPPNQNIVLTFSESVVAGTGNITIKKTSDNSTVEAFNVATGAGGAGGTVVFNATQVTVNANADLDFSTEYYVLVDSTAVKDAANNNYAGISSTTLLSFTTDAAPDSTAPTLSSSVPADNATGVAYDANVALTFSENVIASTGSMTLKKSSDNSTVESFNVATGVGDAGGTVTFDGTTGVTINPFANLGIGVGYYINIPNTAVRDAANNFYLGIADATTLNFTALADTTNPTLSASSPADNATNVPTNQNVVLTFSEDVAAGTGNITIKKTSDNSTVEAFDVATGVGGAGGTVTFSLTQVTVNPFSSLSDGTEYYVLVDATAVDDAYGNSYAGISSTTALSFTSAIPPDTTAPTLSSSTPSDNATGVAVNTNVTLTFSENVSPGQSGTGYIRLYRADATLIEEFDVAIGLGDQGGTVSFNGSTGVTLNPQALLANSTGYYINITTDAVKDNAGNFFAGIANATTLNFTTVAAADTTPPTVAITSTASALKAGETATLTYTFSEDIEDASFTTSDIVVDSGTKGTLTKVSETVYTQTYTPAASTTDTSMVVSIGVSTFRDIALNNNTAGNTLALSVDTAIPTLTITSGADLLLVGQTTLLTFTFSESVTGFVSTDVVLESGSLSGFSGSGSSYTATYTPATNTYDSVNISVAGAAFNDVAGNPGSGSSTKIIDVDTQAPTITSIDSTRSSFNAGQTATMTFNFSEDVGTSFVIGDITAESGSMSAFTKVSGTQYTTTYTPAVNTTDSSVSITVPIGAVSDLQGNTNSAAGSRTVSVDTALPTVDITSSDATLTQGETATLTFTFSESVGTSFDLTDIAATIGTVDNFLQTDSTHYTARYTPPASTTTTATISVAANRFFDPSGNFNNVGDTINLSIDTSAPPAQQTEAADWQRLYDGSQDAVANGLTRQYWNNDILWEWKNYVQNGSYAGDWRDANGTLWGTALTGTLGTFPSQNISGVGVTVNFDVTDIVKSWAANPKLYKGFMLRNTGGGGTVSFHSRETASGTSFKPTLTINYSDAPTQVVVITDSDGSLETSTTTPQGHNTTLKTGGRSIAISFWTSVARRSTVTSATLKLVTATGSTSTSTNVGVYQLAQPDPGLDQTVVTGIAANYTNDVGIENDPDVYLVERFSSSTWYSSTFNGNQKWFPNNAQTGSWFHNLVTSETGYTPLTGQSDNNGHKVYWPDAPDPNLRGAGYRSKRTGWKGNPAAPQEVYLRYYVRPQTSFFNTNDGGKFPGFTWAGQESGCGNGGDACTATGSGWSARGGFETTEYPNNPAYPRLVLTNYVYWKNQPNATGSHFPWMTFGMGAIPLGEWTCVETYMKLNTGGLANGILRAWINGKLTFEQTNFRFVSSGTENTFPVDTVWMEYYHGGTGDPGKAFGLYEDNIVIASKYIGCMQQ